MKYIRNFSHSHRIILLAIICSFVVTLIILFNIRRAEASPSLVVDGTSANGTSYSSQRHVIRTTNGSNGNRTFVLAYDGSGLNLYYSDNPDATSPSWSSISISAATTYPIGDMVWDESNNVIYIAYGRNAPSNNSNSDIFYTRVSSLNTTPSAGTASIALNGTSGATTYNFPNIEIAGDSGTTKVFVFGTTQSSGGNPTGWSVAVGTINSDSPTWSTYSAKTWTAAAAGGILGVTRVNTDKLYVLYYNGTDILASRHDDSASATATSGWDALDGTDNSQTTISSDDPASRGLGSATGLPASDSAWFGWVDAASDINVIRWSGTALETEFVPAAYSGVSVGPALVTDGVYLYLTHRGTSSNTQVTYQVRSATDGTTAWTGTEYLLDSSAEISSYPSVAKKLYQGKLDVVQTTTTSFYVRHASSYKVSGFIYQESASSPYEGTTKWSGCDSSTANIAISIAGGTKTNAVCSSSDGSFYFVLPQPSSTNVDITIYLDTGGGNKGAIFTHNNDTVSDITGLTLYKDKVWIESQSSTSITNSDINTYDQSNDSDIPIASNGTTSTVDANTELHINSGDTYAPGGDVTTPKLHLKGTYSGSTETLTINGSGTSTSCDDTFTNLRPFCIEGGTYTPSSNTTLFTGSNTTLVETTSYHHLRIEPGANSITHTLRSGTLGIGGNLTLGNGTNTGVTLEFNTNDPTVNLTGNLIISGNTTMQSSSTNTLSVAGNWNNGGTFTHNNGTIAFTGADSTTQALSGNTTFYNMSVSTSSNSLGRTIQFAGSSTTTITGAWTIAGFSGKVITLQSSNTSSWTTIPTTASVTYASISRSTNSGTSFCATFSNDGGNNSGWIITGSSSCNQSPQTPTLDAPSNSATNQSLTPALLTTTTDSDSDYLRYKIELCENSGMTTNCQTYDQTSSQTGWSGQNTQTSTAYTSGTQATYTLQTPLANNTIYYWRSYAIDPAGTNSWSSTQGTPNSFSTIPSTGSETLYLNGVNFSGINLY